MYSILLIGSQGQVGRELRSRLSAYGHVTALARPEIDLSEPESLRGPMERALTAQAPRLVINAAAYTAVDRAEQEPALSDAINHQAPRVMAETCAQLGARFIHISTDYVFDGQATRPYSEADPPNPVGTYGKTKLAGEQAIQAVAAQHTDFAYAIVRTAWVYGVGGKGNFVKTMLRLGATQPEVRVVADQVGSPTWAADLAQALSRLGHQLTSTGLGSGIYHYTNNGVISWYDFAVAIFEEAQALGYPLKLQSVVPIRTVDYPTLAQRPSYSVLDCGKISASLGACPPDWRPSLRLMLQELYTQTHERADERADQSADEGANSLRR